MSKSKQIAFLKLYEPIHANFERFCRARVYGNMDYKDLINETLLIAFKKFDTLKEDKAFLSFLFTICIRILANNNKKKKEILTSEGPQVFNDIIGDSDTEKDLNVSLLHEALALLPETQKESLILFEISGFSIKEISKMHNTSESSVKQRLRRGRQKLVEILNFESQYKRGEVTQ
jgi:RNA polymerase sigma-70 factor (ECF subfamily)